MRKRTALLMTVGLAVLAGLVGTFLVVRAESDPEDGVSWVSQVILAPIRPGETGSKVVSERLVARPSDVEEVVLEPMRPEELERPAYEPTETSLLVRGPSDSSKYRCVVVLKPLEEGGKASEPVCGKGSIESVNGVALESLYLIAKFYNDTEYQGLLTEYYGQYPCSSGYSYGRPDLRDDAVDNEFASGEGFSSCDLITLHDWYNYTGPKYACGPNCEKLYALNDAVSSWKVTD
jgi:hypothetical protein